MKHYETCDVCKHSKPYRKRWCNKRKHPINLKSQCDDFTKSDEFTKPEKIDEMETCDKCGRILFLVNIKIREKGKRIIPHLDRIYYCTKCETIKTKGL